MSDQQGRGQGSLAVSMTLVETETPNGLDGSMVVEIDAVAPGRLAEIRLGWTRLNASGEPQFEADEACEYAIDDAFSELVAELLIARAEALGKSRATHRGLFDLDAFVGMAKRRVAERLLPGARDPRHVTAVSFVETYVRHTVEEKAAARRDEELEELCFAIKRHPEEARKYLKHLDGGE